MRPRRRMRKGKSYILFAFRWVDFARHIHNKAGSKRICGWLQSKHANGQQERLNSAELDTVRVSRSPTTVITVNDEVLTKEEATVYVRELDIFLTIKVLDNTPAVLSLGKICDENGYSYEWINGQKPHLMKNGIRIPCKTENFVPIVVPGLSTSSSSSTNMTPFKAGNWSSYHRQFFHSGTSAISSTMAKR